MEKTTRQIRRCPKCNQEYVASPAISRQDNKTEICPSCGLLEGLDAFSKHIEEEKKNAAKSYRLKNMLMVFLILLIALLSISAGLCVQVGEWPFAFLAFSLIVINLIHFSKLFDV